MYFNKLFTQIIFFLCMYIQIFSIGLKISKLNNLIHTTADVLVQYFV